MLLVFYHAVLQKYIFVFWTLDKLWSFRPLVESWAKIIALPLQEYSYKLWEHWHFMVFAENFSVSLNILSPIFLKILENIFYHSLQSYVLQKKTNDNLVRLRLYYPTLGVFKQVQNWKRCAVQQCILINLALRRIYWESLIIVIDIEIFFSVL